MSLICATKRIAI